MIRGLIVAVGVALVAPTIAPAQDNCATHDIILIRLAENWSETRQTSGIAANGTLVETWANADTGTWTITVSVPDGPTCIVAYGQDFDLINTPA